MRVLAVFAFIQITGILGRTIAPEPYQTQNKEFAKVQVLQSIFNEFKFWHLDEYPPGWIMESGMKCRINGGIDAETAAVEGLGTYFDSLIELTNDTQLKLETASNPPHTGLDSAVQTACHWFTTTTHTLISNLMSSLRPCWSTGESTSADLFHRISSALLQYACEDEGRRVSAFLTADGDDCFISTRDHIRSCTEASFSIDTSIIEHDVDSRPITVPWDVPVVTLNNQACREFGTFQKCVVGLFRRCENQTPSRQINSLFDIVTKTSGCEAILEQ